ncbi:MAG: hypothetical protein Q8M03_08535 [Legionella sp.]|nr:hypothetical protein [Legionella sp.]
MEPVTIAIICAAVFGVAVTLAAFVRQLLLSRDKALNDKAQQNAIAKEAEELSKLRLEMSNNKRFDSHYQVLGANKDAIQYLDQKIEENFNKKSELIQRYALAAIKESSAIINGDQPPARKAICDKLKEEIDNEIKFYNKEIEQLQERRANLWDSHVEFQDYLLDQEKRRNEQLDVVYQKHTGMLEKIYQRHNDNTAKFAHSSLDASSQTFKSILLAPIQFLAAFFKISKGISPEVVQEEAQSREKVSDAEKDINGNEDGDDIMDNKDKEVEKNPSEAFRGAFGKIEI